MFNKKRIIAIVAFLLLSFFIITFAGGRGESELNVIFTDGFDDTVIDEQTIEHGEDAIVPEDPYHKDYVFGGWYLFGSEDTKVSDFTNLQEDLKVEARYADDKNNNGIADDDDTYYDVTFVNGRTDEVIETQEVLAGMNAEAPVAQTYDGYTFTGWDSSYVNVRSNITVTSEYSRVLNYFDVNFYNKERVVFTSQEIVENGTINFIASIPTYKGYTLEGWYTGVNGTGTEYEVGDIVNSNLNLYGYWKINKEEVVFNSEGGELIGGSDEIPEELIVNYGTEIEIPNALKNYTLTYHPKDGKVDSESNSIKEVVEAKLLGWCIDKKVCTTEELVQVGEKIVIEKDTTLNAIWGAAKTKIELLSATHNNKSESKVYTFSGWSILEDSSTVNYSSGTNIELIGDLDLYAVYSSLPRQYDIIINPGDGENDGDIDEEETVDYGTKITLPSATLNYNLTYMTYGGSLDENAVIKRKAEFKGWCKDSTTCTEEELIEANTEVEVVKNVTYNAVYGSALDEITLVGSTYPNSDEYTYTFSGWSLTKDGSISLSKGSTLTLESDMTLHAIYSKEKNQYTIEVDPGDGENDGDIDEEETVDYGTKITLPSATLNYNLTYMTYGGSLDENAVIKRKAEFKGWCKDSTTCTEEELIEANTEVEVVKNVTYNAVYGNALDEITLVGSTYPNSDEYTYTFSGWALTKDGSVSYTKGSTLTLDSDMTLHAIYSKETNQYRLTLNPGEGSLPSEVINPNDYAYNTKVLLPKPTLQYTLTYNIKTNLNEGLTSGNNTVSVLANFKGWCKDSTTCTAEELIEANTEVEVVKNVTYNAVYGASTSPITIVGATKENTNEVTYAFVKWIGNDENDYSKDQVIYLSKDITLAPTFNTSSTTHPVGFVTDYGQTPSTQYIPFGGLVVEPETLIAESHTFENWYTENTYEVSWNFEEDTVSNPLTLYAKWNIKSYDLNLVLNGGTLDTTTLSTSQTLNHGTEYRLPSAQKSYTLTYAISEDESLTGNTNPVVRQLSLLGWCEGTSTCEVDNRIAAGTEKTLTSEKTYYAVWGEANSITIDNATKDETLEHYYELKGWTFTEGKIVVDKTIGSEIILTKNETLYPIFEENDQVYTLTLDANGGTITNMDSVTDHSYNNLVTLPTAEKNYTLTYNVDGGTVDAGAETSVKAQFKGWCPGNATTTPCESPITGDINMTESKKYYAVYGVAEKSLEIVGASGYKNNTTVFEFNNWISTSGSNTYNEGDDITLNGNTTLNAQYNSSDRLYIVEFITNGHGTKPSNQSVKYNNTVNNPGELSATGYTFNGWYKDSELTTEWNFTSDTVTSDNTKIYASWTINTYTLEVHLAGNSAATYDINSEIITSSSSFKSYNYDYNELVKITNIDPKSGFYLKSIKVGNGEPISVTGTVNYSFNMPAGDTKVILTFASLTENVVLDNSPFRRIYLDNYMGSRFIDLRLKAAYIKIEETCTTDRFGRERCVTNYSSKLSPDPKVYSSNSRKNIEDLQNYLINGTSLGTLEQTYWGEDPANNLQASDKVVDNGWHYHTDTRAKYLYVVYQMNGNKYVIEYIRKYENSDEYEIGYFLKHS